MKRGPSGCGAWVRQPGPVRNAPPHWKTHNASCWIMIGVKIESRKGLVGSSLRSALAVALAGGALSAVSPGVSAGANEADRNAELLEAEDASEVVDVDGVRGELSLSLKSPRDRPDENDDESERDGPGENETEASCEASVEEEKYECSTAPLPFPDPTASSASSSLSDFPAPLEYQSAYSSESSWPYRSSSSSSPAFSADAWPLRSSLGGTRRSCCCCLTAATGGRTRAVPVTFASDFGSLAAASSAAPFDPCSCSSLFCCRTCSMPLPASFFPSRSTRR